MKPFHFQIRVAHHLLNGRNVILQAPTGAGKTRAALLGWLNATEANQPERFPWRCIYSVPMRVLANQFLKKFEPDLAKFATKIGQNAIRARIQTGEQPDDPRFENALIFATLDQTLSSALGMPYSLSMSMANFNAGAVMSSYLIFDEFHLFGREQALPTTLHLLRMLKGITPFCLMTATFSPTLLHRLATLLDAEIVTVDQAERLTIPSQKDKARRYHVVESLLDAEQVLNGFQQRAIAICNTVDRATTLYRDIQERLRQQGVHDVEVRLLHSRFYQQNRTATTEWVEREFAEGWQTRNDKVQRAILVTTQVVEVGMDITCETLHTELAPASTLIQRAGRCARFAKENGDVFIYQLPLNKKGQISTAPYDMKEGRDLCARTYRAFALPERNGATLDYDEEVAILEEVHAADDAAMLEEIERNKLEHQKMMLGAMVRHEYSNGDKLIRDVDNVSLVIHHDPNSDPLLQRSPWARQMLQIPYGTFRKWVTPKKPTANSDEAEVEGEDDLSKTYPLLDARTFDDVEARYGLDWTIKVPEPLEKEGNEQLKGEPRFIWKTATVVQDLIGRTFAINPYLVSYSSKTGLVLEPNPQKTEDALPRITPPKPRKEYTYHLETYREHIAGLWRVYTGGFQLYRESSQTWEQYPALQQEVAYTLPRLASAFGITPAQLEMVWKWVVVGHDVGKLGVQWQRWVQRWQNEKLGKPVEATHCYAHTDFDNSEAQKQLQRELGPRPTHAAESAEAVLKILIATCGLTGRQTTPALKSLFSAALSAIARHHGATHNGGVDAKWQLSQHAYTALRETMTYLEAEGDIELLSKRVVDSRGVQRYMVVDDLNAMLGVVGYLWFSRLLRQSDQQSLNA